MPKKRLFPPLRLLDMDSRVHGVSVGVSGVVRPLITPDGQNEAIYCLSCGKSSGYVTRELPPGVIFVCDACTARSGPLPLEVVSFAARQ